jgi:hypothetical protein
MIYPELHLELPSERNLAATGTGGANEFKTKLEAGILKAK